MANSGSSLQQQRLINKEKRVVVIVPVTGKSPFLFDQLHSILAQDYPFAQLLCVTATKDDSAVPVIERLHRGDTRVRHICAGQAKQCSQKNHNLLAGYHAIDGFDGILVFCDAGHIMGRQWLGNLIQPLLFSEEVSVSSGYHYVMPTPAVFTTTCRAVIVQALCTVRKIPLASQPWGGATAIAAREFRDLDIATLWSDTVVDDVVLAGHLKEKKKLIAIPDDGDVTTYVQDASFSSLCLWLTRQWAYLKFVFPKTWLALGMGGILFTLFLYLAITLLGTCWLFDYPRPLVMTAVIIVLTFLLFSYYLRTQHPAPGPALLWYPACCLSTLLAGWCHAAMWYKDEIVWSGICYTVTQKGRVTALEKSKNL